MGIWVVFIFCKIYGVFKSILGRVFWGKYIELRIDFGEGCWYIKYIYVW